MTSAGQGDARRLASGSLMQQVAQVTGLLVTFVIITVLARRLTLAELGVYGLLGSIAGYLLIVQNAAAGAAVRNIAAGAHGPAAATAYSTAVAAYVAAGLATGVVVALTGVALAAGLDLTDEVERQARLGAAALGGVTAIGWPVTIHRDALRADGMFVRAAWVEIGALCVYAALVLGLAFADAPLWVLIGASGTIPLLAGLGCFGAARAARLPYRFARRDVTRSAARELGGLAGYVSATEAAAAAIFTLNRAILGLFESAATIGLYEGPVRAHNLLRSLGAATTVTVLPTAARYTTAGDDRRLRELTLRGSRYSLALAVPLAVTGMVLAGPILESWLGAGFEEGGTAMAILLSHWVLGGANGVLGAVLVGTGRARELARWAVAVSVADVALALALVPWLGLEGVALATAIPYFLLFPMLARSALDAGGLEPVAFVRRAIVPAWLPGLGLAVALVVARLALDPRSAIAVAATALVGLAAYWALYYSFALLPSERRLVRDVAAGGLGRRS